MPLNFSSTAPHWREKIRAIKKLCHLTVFSKNSRPKNCLLLKVPVSRLISLVSCLLSPVSWLLSLEFCLLSHVSFLTSPVSRLLSHVSCLRSPFSQVLSHIFCLTSPVSRLLSHVCCPSTEPNYVKLFQTKTKLHFPHVFHDLVVTLLLSPHI